MEDYIAKFLDIVDPQYLALEGSIRTMFNENQFCRPCAYSEVTCCETSGETRNLMLLTHEYDKHILDKSIPNWRTLNQLREKDSKCALLTDKGCSVELGRPNVCVTHLCKKYSNLLTPEEQEALHGYSDIASLMSLIITEGTAEDDFVNYADEVNHHFMIAQKAITNSDKFSNKFSYTPVVDYNE